MSGSTLIILFHPDFRHPEPFASLNRHALPALTVRLLNSENRAYPRLPIQENTHCRNSLTKMKRLIFLKSVRGPAGYIHRLRTFGTFGDIELNTLTLGERPKSVALNRRVMHKDIFPIIHRDESVPFDLIEPLDLTIGHTLTLLCAV